MMPPALQLKLVNHCFIIASEYLALLYDTVLVGHLLIYFALYLLHRCADGYMGPRCEYKDLDGSYLRKLFRTRQISDIILKIYLIYLVATRPRVMLEKASIASGVMLAIVMMVILVCCWLVHKNRENKRKFLESSATNGVDTVDSVNQRRPFAGDYRQISMEDAFVRHN